jgi:hypothetical protein
MRHRPLLWLLPILLLGCASHMVAPPPATIRTIAVLPPNNRTGDPLLVSGTSLLEKYVFRSPSVTVADVLEAEARGELERRGYTVVPPQTVAAAMGTQVPTSPSDAADLAARGKLDGTVLYIEIRQWQPALEESMQPRRVLVALGASLVDVATGHVVWTKRLQLRPVPTPGAVTRTDADMIAVHKVTAELLASWQPERPPS